MRCRLTFPGHPGNLQTIHSVMADTKAKEKALEYDAYYSQSSEGEEEEEEDDIGWHFEEETGKKH